MSPRTTAAGAARSTAGRPAIPATAAASAGALLVEEVFGWIKTVGAGGKLRYLGRARNKLWLELTAAAYNLTRLANLETAAA